jgi:hypothetical protein
VRRSKAARLITGVSAKETRIKDCVATARIACVAYRKNEVLEWRQLGIELVNPLLQSGHVDV